jgi:hypothetical protein
MAITHSYGWITIPKLRYTLCFVLQRRSSGNNESTLWWILSMPIAVCFPSGILMPESTLPAGFNMVSGCAYCWQETHEAPQIQRSPSSSHSKKIVISLSRSTVPGSIPVCGCPAGNNMEHFHGGYCLCLPCANQAAVLLFRFHIFGDNMAICSDYCVWKMSCPVL